MISRYTRPEMGKIWTEETKLAHWVEIECLVLEVLAAEGRIPKEVPGEVRKKAKADPARVAEIEKETRHDVIAFLTHLEETLGDHARYIHWGLTSSDLLDTALALQMSAAADLILQDLASLRQVLARRAMEFKDLVMVGRTHGVHAEPITLGLKLALWFEEVGRGAGRMTRAKEAVRVGKIAGAVGTYAHISPRVEEYVCERLNLRPAPIASQVIQRDRHAEYMSALALIAASVAKMATEIRHLSRTEVGEVAEAFGKGQKGSSAMPHKRNPIVSEQLTGLARVVGANAATALQNVGLWHERDISHSSVERVILPDSTILVDYMVTRFSELMDGLVVNKEAIRRNLDLSRGLIHSEQVLLALLQAGLSRKAAYETVQRLSFKTVNENKYFRAVVQEDSEVKARLSPEALAACFDLSPHVAHVGTLFGRVFGPPDEQRF